jgi:hypothetical protein
MPADDPRSDPAPPRSRFRETLIRVLIVQAVALAVLWLLQLRYDV